MSQEALKMILMSLENQHNVSFTHDEISRWSIDTLTVLENAGILRPNETALSVTCDGCEEACLEDVEFSRGDDGSLVGWVICKERDDIGRVRVSPERLKTWVIIPSAFVSFLAGEFVTRSTPKEILPGRLWSLGRMNVNGTAIDSFFARGVKWPDARTVFSKSALLRSYIAPLIFVVDESQRLSLFGDAAVVAPLGQMISIVNNHICLDASNVCIGDAIPLKRTKDIFQHSPDYRSVCLRGRKYSLTTTQASVIECLWKSWQNNTPDISQDYILETILNTTQIRLKDIFKGCKDWQLLIVKGKTRGTYRLNY